jgi:hypothetical protein
MKQVILRFAGTGVTQSGVMACRDFSLLGLLLGYARGSSVRLRPETAQLVKDLVEFVEVARLLDLSGNRPGERKVIQRKCGWLWCRCLGLPIRLKMGSRGYLTWLLQRQDAPKDDMLI